MPTPAPTPPDAAPPSSEDQNRYLADMIDGDKPMSGESPAHKAAMRTSLAGILDEAELDEIYGPAGKPATADTAARLDKLNAAGHSARLANLATRAPPKKG